MKMSLLNEEKLMLMEKIQDFAEKENEFRSLKKKIDEWGGEETV